MAQLKVAINMLGVGHLWKDTKNPLELTYLPSGNKIIFRGMDDPESITSVTTEVGGLCWCWIEECFQCSDYESFEKLDMSIRGSTSLPEEYFDSIIASMNPWSPNTFWKEKFFDVYEKGEQRERIYCCTTTYIQNEFLREKNPEYYYMIESMKETNPKRYEILGLGNWGIAEGLVFENWIEEEFNIQEIRTRTKKDGKPYYKELFGLDWGFSNDPTAVIACSVSEKDRVIYVWDEIYEYKCSNDELVRLLQNHGLDKCLIYADYSDEKSIYDLRSLGVTRIRKCSKGPNSVLAGIQRLQDYKIIVHPRTCPNFIIELTNYVWDKDKDGKQINKPIDEFNHCVTGDTVVHTTTGDLTIEELCDTLGYVRCFDTNTATQVIAPFNSVRKTGKQCPVYKITLEDGTVVRATSEHPFLTDTCWKQLHELEKGDFLIKLED